MSDTTAPSTTPAASAAPVTAPYDPELNLAFIAKLKEILDDNKTLLTLASDDEADLTENGFAAFRDKAREVYAMVATGGAGQTKVTQKLLQFPHFLFQLEKAIHSKCDEKQRLIHITNGIFCLVEALSTRGQLSGHEPEGASEEEKVINEKSKAVMAISRTFLQGLNHALNLSLRPLTQERKEMMKVDFQVGDSQVRQIITKFKATIPDYAETEVEQICCLIEDIRVILYDLHVQVVRRKFSTSSFREAAYLINQTAMVIFAHWNYPVYVELKSIFLQVRKTSREASSGKAAPGAPSQDKAAEPEVSSNKDEAKEEGEKSG